MRRFDKPKLRPEILPRPAIIDQSVDPLPKLRIHRVVKFTLPPEIKRQIGIEMRKNNARQQLRARAFEQKRQLFGTNLFASGAPDMAMRVDPGGDATLFACAFRFDHQRAAGVVLGDFADQRRIALQ